MQKYAIRIVQGEECFGANRRKLFAICKEEDVARFRKLARRTRCVYSSDMISVTFWN